MLALWRALEGAEWGSGGQAMVGLSVFEGLDRGSNRQAVGEGWTGSGGEGGGGGGGGDCFWVQSRNRRKFMPPQSGFN